MEISLREWLVIGGVVVIVLIIFDGWRRVRGGRNSLRMDIDRKARDLPDEVAEPASNPELPNGGARPISGAAPEFVPKRKPGSAYAAKMVSMPKTADAPTSEPAEQPTLRTPERSTERRAPERHASERIEPTFGFSDEVEEVSAPRPAAASQARPAAAPRTAAAVQPDVAVDGQRAKMPEAEPRTAAAPVAEAPARAVQRPVSQQPLAPVAEADPLFDDPIEDDYPSPRGASVADAGAKPAETAPAQEPSAEPAKEPAAKRPEPGRAQEASPQSTQDNWQDSTLQANTLQETPGFGETDPLFDDLPTQPALDLEKPIPLLMERNRQPKRASAAATAPAADKKRADAAPVAAGAKAKEKAAPQPQQDQLFGTAQEASSSAQARPGDNPPNPDNVLVITAVSTAAEGFAGGLLYRLVSACDLHFGDMAIFHRHEDGSDSGPVQFSMANAVNPGTFDLVTIDQIRTPAVTFFMSMEEPRDVMHAFECMLATAETLAEHLDGDLLDENRSVLRPQTKEHYRQRIRDFEMHNRSRRGGSRA